MKYKKKVDDKVVETFADGNTYYRTDGITSAFAETKVIVDENLVLDLFIGNEEGYNNKKTLTINKKTLRDWGIELVIEE